MKSGIYKNNSLLHYKIHSLYMSKLPDNVMANGKARIIEKEWLQRASSVMGC